MDGTSYKRYSRGHQDAEAVSFWTTRIVPRLQQKKWASNPLVAEHHRTTLPTLPHGAIRGGLDSWTIDQTEG